MWWGKQEDEDLLRAAHKHGHRDFRKIKFVPRIFFVTSSICLVLDIFAFQLHKNSLSDDISFNVQVRQGHFICQALCYVFRPGCASKGTVLWWLFKSIVLTAHPGTAICVLIKEADLDYLSFRMRPQLQGKKKQCHRTKFLGQDSNDLLNHSQMA